MKILRFEHPADQKGPYNSVHGICFDHGDLGHPSPYEEMGRSLAPDERCGFSGLVQLQSWFNEEEREMIREAGFKLYEIDIGDSNVTTLGHQVVFKFEHIIKKQEVSF